MGTEKYFPNNRINKKKYKKHSMSPFVSLDAGDVEYNIGMFNKMAGNSEPSAVSEELEDDYIIKSIDGHNIYLIDGEYFVDGTDVSFVSEDEAIEYVREGFEMDTNTKVEFGLSEIRDKLNSLDIKAIDEDLKYNDLRNLFEAVNGKLTPEEREEIKNVIQNTDDAEIIAAALQSKLDDQEKTNEDFTQPHTIDDELTEETTPVYQVFLYGQNRRVKKPFATFDTEIEAEDFCNDHDWEYIDPETRFQWNMDYTTVYPKDSDKEIYGFSLKEDLYSNYYLFEFKDKEDGRKYQDEYEAGDRNEAWYWFRKDYPETEYDFVAMYKLTDEGYERIDIYEELNESLTEKLVEAPQEVVDALIGILEENGFILDDEFKGNNPGKTWMGNIHLQVINPDSYINDDEEESIQEQLRKYITDALIDAIHDLDKESNCPITWNFGVNDQNKVTGGLDIMKQYVEDDEEEEEAVEIEEESLNEDSNNSWKKEYNTELGREEYYLKNNNGSAFIYGFDNDGHWGYHATVDPIKGRKYSKSFYLKGSLEKAKEFCEKHLVNYTDESLNEASYGGAYDIEDDMYFTREEIVEFADEIIDELNNEWSEHTYNISDIGFDSPTDLYIEIDDDEGYSFNETFKIDMRKIRSPRDIYKYKERIVAYFKNAFSTEYEYEERVDTKEECLKEADEDSYFTNLIDTDDIDVIDEFINEVDVNTAYNLLDYKSLITELYNQYVNDYKKFPKSNSMDSLDQKYSRDHGRFYKKWKPVIDKCKQIIKSSSVTGYGKHDIFVLKILDMLKSMEYNFPYGWKHEFSESLSEDTVKTSNGEWTNKGDSGETHGKFKTKKAADAQRKAMFANGYKGESLKEEYGDEFEEGSDGNYYRYIKSKMVYDSDGFTTDYTLYMKLEPIDDRFNVSFVTVFGDSDLYRPDDGYYDWEGDTIEEAMDWFNNYKGPGEDDFDESLSVLAESKVKRLNNREKQVYINEIEQCEDREDLEDIVHEIFFYDKALFAMLNKFPKDTSFEELKKNKLDILKDSLLDENLNEDRTLARPIKKDIKNRYKSFDRNRDYVNKYNTKQSKMLKDKGIDPDDELAKEIFMKKEPKFNNGLSSYQKLETEEYPFYVTYYVESPNYHPEEGGYYSASSKAVYSKGFDNKEEAIKYAQELADESGLNRVDNKHYSLSSKYIGEEEHIWVETSKDYLSREEQDHPYM